MKPVTAKATPAAIAMLRQATALAPKRSKASDGLLPSAAHLNQNPDSDHNTGMAVDLTHDPKNGIDCSVIFKNLKQDPRVKYLIFQGVIWFPGKDNRVYTGSNKHMKHLHVSIKDGHGWDTYDWFPWMGGPKKWNKVKSKFIKVKAIKQDPPSPKED